MQAYMLQRVLRSLIKSLLHIDFSVLPAQLWQCWRKPCDVRQVFWRVALIDPHGWHWRSPPSNQNKQTCKSIANVRSDIMRTMSTSLTAELTVLYVAMRNIWSIEISFPDLWYVKKNKIKYFQASDIILAHVKYKFTVSDYCSFWGAAVKIKWQTTILLRCLLREPVMKHSTLFGINTHNTSRSLSAEELPFETQTVVSHQTSVLLDFSIWEMSCSQV